MTRTFWKTHCQDSGLIWVFSVCVLWLQCASSTWLLFVLCTMCSFVVYVLASPTHFLFISLFVSPVDSFYSLSFLPYLFPFYLPDSCLPLQMFLQLMFLSGVQSSFFVFLLQDSLPVLHSLLVYPCLA